MNYFFNFVTGRSHKERSSYAPKGGLRYDGSYWIKKCWRKIGIQGFKVCRYLFVRCNNDPAPWTSDEHGDWHRPLLVILKLKNAVDVTKRKEGSHGISICAPQAGIVKGGNKQMSHKQSGL
ncbi:hypothetical protein JRO89_XSUnG0148400 [Xanthoceras sorbifolium]|uniref:YDG domain-containing protein n=1 Tax=Xanthoceras sorbifolium TaxID=99658 RepID=A0ABQ8GXY9_9ROSI|nr:hypothetical protein JRO89_XSUnG0148400 [Xanthoceras sorbifolium]